VAMYGGFAGDESELTDRTNVTQNVTVLSGDLNSSGTPNAGDSARIVDMAADTVVDGFTIKHGYKTSYAFGVVPGRLDHLLDLLPGGGQALLVLFEQLPGFGVAPLGRSDLVGDSLLAFGQAVGDGSPGEFPEDGHEHEKHDTGPNGQVGLPFQGALAVASVRASVVDSVRSTTGGIGVLVRVLPLVGRFTLSGMLPLTGVLGSGGRGRLVLIAGDG